VLRKKEFFHAEAQSRKERRRNSNEDSLMGAGPGSTQTTKGDRLRHGLFSWSWI
jgi:hypothetical protein